MNGQTSIDEAFATGSPDDRMAASVTAAKAAVERGMAAQRAADEAIARVERNAREDWIEAALNVVKGLAMVRERIVADDVWDELEALKVDGPHEPRAMGAVMRRAKANGWVEATGTWIKGRREQGHGHPAQVWRSRVYGKAY